MKRPQAFITIAFLFCIYFNSSGQLQWPEISSQNKPWTRWWWQGSAVDTTNLSRAMDQYYLAGIGGLEIVPIYGVKGYENQFIPYLSEAWMQMLNYTLLYAKKLNLGIDMANGTGWPFGGKYVMDRDAAKCLYSKYFILHEGELLTTDMLYEQPAMIRTVRGNKIDIAQLKQPVSANNELQTLAIDQIKFPALLKAQLVMAYDKAGKSSDITNTLDDSGRLNWKAPAGEWRIVALYTGIHGKMVERAAPGAEGYAIDHFSREAITRYLQKFDTAFANTDISSLRCFFNDSYEVDDAMGQADWTPEFLTEFKNRRGYDLRDYLPALLQKDTLGISSRVIYDYRNTISELMLDNFTQTWHNWATVKEASIRNQAHGSPANILDLYAASDIPETEGKDILRFKFAASAGNVTGKTLISAETATWLKDHFLSTLGDVKKAVDLCFLGGVNHIVYHGTAYSPASDPWPGWLFYAAVHFQPTNPFWSHFPALNNYVAHCQSFLQQGHADNDVLLYYPISDRFSDPGTYMLRHFDGMEKEFDGTGFKENAGQMLQKGYAFDYVSDRQLQKLRFQDNLIHADASAYQVIVVPGCKYMPVETWQHLFKLVYAGAKVIFFRTMPDDIPGLSNYEKNKQDYLQLLSNLTFTQSGQNGIRQATYGKGLFIVGSEISDLLTFAGIRREPMVDKQIQFVRRKISENTLYLIVNKSATDYEGWLPIQCKAAAVGLFDAMSERIGVAEIRKTAKGNIEAFIQLKAGKSLLLEAFSEKTKGKSFTYRNVAGQKKIIEGRWTINFVEGGPVLPPAVETTELKSWTEWNDPDIKYFSGIANYSIHFAKPKGKIRTYLLDLGIVKESAEVWINGKLIATLIDDDYSTIIDASVLKADNLLEIKVANGMANRIINMEQQGVIWKKFYNTNFPAFERQNRGADGLFSAAGWEPLPSGLLGPVTLTPLK
jgi:hypothetical protein